LSNKKKPKKFYKKYTQHIFKLDDSKNKIFIGNKALNLKFLHKQGFKIPTSFVCSFEAFNLYKKGDPTIVTDLKEELEYYIDENKSYAIRSSANTEDQSNISFAGQFQTKLNLKGIDNIILNIVKVWNSLEDIKLETYSKKLGQNPDRIEMGIIIQEMVSAEFSGVVFTRNPLTGLNEIVIESVKGLGENLVQGGITPERWVYKWGDWIEIPTTSEIKTEIISDIAQEAIKIAKKYGEPLDLEWAYDGQDLYWLQLRQITTLKNNKLYSNKLSREFLPGIIKPLIWSVNIPVVNTAWKHIFRLLIGSAAKKIDINKLARPFYYRAYFNMKIMGNIFEMLGMPRDLLESLAGIESEGKDKPSFKPSGITLRYLPRMILFCLDLYTFSEYIQKFLKYHSKEYAIINSINIDDQDERSCLEVINKLFKLNIKASYIVIITQLLNSFYNKLLKNKLKKNSIEFEDLDFTAINKRLEFSDPRAHISKLHKEFKSLSENDKKKINRIKYETFLRRYADTKFTQEFQKFVSKFGYLRDSGNDFSQPSWSETPQIMLKMVLDYEEPKVKKNYEERIRLIKKYVFKSRFSKSIFKRAIRYLEYRQTVTNLYSFGYGLFRIFFLKIAELLVNKGLIIKNNDIFYMTYDEVRELIENSEKAEISRNKISKRKKEIKECRDFQLPDIIYDDFLPKPINTTNTIKELKGIPTSKGFYTGPVKIVKGIKDMDKIQDGDIIAIPYSDVSWTPLFTKAKAVISESGGILSHCSIVAREYNIPAIVSVNGATLLKDNTLIAVNAYNGKISLLKKTHKAKVDDEDLEITISI
jgi:pyruvate,water dikinase